MFRYPVVVGGGTPFLPPVTEDIARSSRLSVAAAARAGADRSARDSTDGASTQTFGAPVEHAESGTSPRWRKESRAVSPTS